MSDKGKNIQAFRWIAAPPALVTTGDDTVNGWLAALPAPNFETVADTKALWAAHAAHPEGSASPAGSAWVVSAETLKRIRGRRFS